MVSRQSCRTFDVERPALGLQTRSGQSSNPDLIRKIWVSFCAVTLPDAIPGPTHAGREGNDSASKGKEKPARTAKAPVKHASLFRHGARQAVCLPKEFRFPERIKEVCIRRQGDSLLMTPIRPDGSPSSPSMGKHLM